MSPGVVENERFVLRDARTLDPLFYTNSWTVVKIVSLVDRCRKERKIVIEDKRYKGNVA